MNETCDYLLVGAGIVGLSIAREIKARDPGAKIIMLEKEERLGMHASGRNSGVLHTGIYYPTGTLKAKLCRAGAQAMLAYAREHQIPYRQDGKIIVATSEQNADGIELLLANAKANQIDAVKVCAEEISNIEPHATREYGGIYCRETAVIDSVQVVEMLRHQLLVAGVQIKCLQNVISIDDGRKEAVTQNRRYNYGMLVNAAGAHADVVARLAGVGCHYQLVPFKGLYYKLIPETVNRVRASIYPIPNPALPFLGIHFTRVIHGDVYIGPTTIPALGRENYGILKGVKPTEVVNIGLQLARLYATNPQNFRTLANHEIPNYLRRCFLTAARKLIDRLEPEWVQSTPKVGIRPQLLNIREGKLEMDFLIERGSNSVHILNSISPAFTSSFAFASHVVDDLVRH